MRIKLLGILFALIYTLQAQSQQQFSLQLTTTDSVVEVHQPFQLNLLFTNDSARYATLIVPRAIEALGVLSIQYFEKVNGTYKLLYDEAALKDSIFVNYITAKTFTLTQNQSAHWPLFINDSIHFSKVPEAHHAVAVDSPRTLYIKVVYNPTLLFFGDTDTASAMHYLKYEHNMQVKKPILESNFVKIQFVAQGSKQKNSPNTNLCRAVNRGQWGRVQAILKRKSKRASKRDNTIEKYDCIAAQYYYPDAILSSLPSYSYNIIVFKNQNGFHFFNVYWQLGKVYKGARAIYVANSIFRSNLQASNHKVVLLKSLKPITR